MASNLESFVCEAADAVKFKLGKSKLSKPSKKSIIITGFAPQFEIRLMSVTQKKFSSPTW